MMNDPTSGNLAGDLARQVKAARREIAELESGNDWQDRQAWWIGALEYRLKMLCDQIDYLLAGTR